MEEKNKMRNIRSELTQEQENSLTHPGPSDETIERIRSNLEELEKRVRRGDKMKKKDFMKAIADSASVTEIQAEKVLDVYYRIIEKRLKEGRRVVISDFGTFTIEWKNWAKTVHFRAAKKLLESL